MRLGLAALFSVAVACPIHAQSPRVFEAVSVRPSSPNTAFRSSFERSQLVANGHTLVMLIATSYPALPMWRISGGPPWVTKDRWDIAAKLPPGMPEDQEQLWRKTEQMLRTALVDEFGLQTHFEHRELPVYQLVVSKGGPKFKPSVTAEFSSRATTTGMEVSHVTMGEFAEILYCHECKREIADRVVVDRTGLTDYYDLTLNWAPANVPSDSANPQPSIFTAVQDQLGLKLEPSKGPVDFLIIDRAERPAQN
jgi:uncharacterized protein (TIGR03435 family)